MPWNAIDPAVPGEIIAAAWFNEQVGDNLTWLKTHGPSLPGQQALDFIYAQSADTLARMYVLPGHVPRIDPTGTAWQNFRTVGTHEMYLPASAFRPRVVVGTNGAMGWHEVIATAGGGEVVAMKCRYGAGVINDASITFAVPKAWNETTQVGFEVFWLCDVSDPDGWAMAWQVFPHAASHGQYIQPGSTPFATAPPQAGFVGYPRVLTISPRGQMTIGDAGPNKLVQLLVRRAYGEYGDSFADVYFVGLKLYFITDALTDD